jgi:NADPH-dependent 2,4-dienoyl-CoA reductase/sulfur reductase-like enzyme
VAKPVVCVVGAGTAGLAIADLVADVRATWVVDRASVVREAERSVLTRDGDVVGFDFLLLAPGARSRRALRQGYVWERGADPSFLDQIILDLVARKVRSVAVAIPRGARWPLPPTRSSASRLRRPECGSEPVRQPPSTG